MSVQPGDKILLKANLNREYLPTNRKQVIYLQVEITPPAGTQYAGGLPSAICLCFDKSGSMEGDKIDQAKLAALQLLHRMQGNDYIGLVSFAAEVEKVAPMIQMKSINPSDLENKINGLQAEGTTELYRGLNAAYEQLLQVSQLTKNAVKRIILLSDGQPTDEVPDAEFAKLAKRIREMGISVLALGIGPDYNEDLLGSIAENSAGGWKHIASPDDIPAIFAQKLDETKTVIRVMPELQITLSKDVELKELIKVAPETNPITNSRMDGNIVKIPLSDMRAGEIQILEAMLQSPQLPEGEYRIARVKLGGDDGDSLDILANYTANEKLWEAENNAFVRGDFLLAKTRIKARSGLSGDQSALEEATRIRQVLASDPTLIRDKASRQEVEDIGKTIIRARKGDLDAEETKIRKEEMTVIRKKPQP